MESLFAKEELENEIVELKIQLLSRFHSFQLDEIQSLIKHINFESFLSNEEICWSKELFEIVKNEIDWSLIYKIKNFNFVIDTSFLIEFENHVDFESLHMLNNVAWSYEIFELYKDRISHKCIYKSNLLFTNSNIFKFFESDIDWDLLSRSTKLEFSIDFIEKYKNQINWKIFSKNPKMPVSVDFIKKYETKIDFDSLSQNPTSINLILNFSKSKKWNWKNVVLNPAIDFSDENINFFIENFNRYLFETGKTRRFHSRFAGFLVRFLMFNQSKSRDFFIQEKYLDFIPWDIFSANCNTQLSLLKIEQFKLKLNFKITSIYNKT
jgi:hypothetical protein